MYDQKLSGLQQSLRMTHNRYLRALAENDAAADALKCEEDDLNAKVEAEKKAIQQKESGKNAQDQENQQATRAQRIKIAQEQIAALDMSKRSATVSRSGSPDRAFTHGELLPKIAAILSKVPDFMIGERDERKLRVAHESGTIRFLYQSSGWEDKKFVLEASTLESLDAFQKSLIVRDCEYDGQSDTSGPRDISEEDFQYQGRWIIDDLFSTFAEALYKED